MSYKTVSERKKLIHHSHTHVIIPNHCGTDESFNSHDAPWSWGRVSGLRKTRRVIWISHPQSTLCMEMVQFLVYFFIQTSCARYPLGTDVTHHHHYHTTTTTQPPHQTIQVCWFDQEWLMEVISCNWNITMINSLAHHLFFIFYHLCV